MLRWTLILTISTLVLLAVGIGGMTALILVSALYLLVYDLRRPLHWLWYGSWSLPDEPSIEDQEAVQSSSMLGAGDVANAN
jgi:arginine exporter protein ArgO